MIAKISRVAMLIAMLTAVGAPPLLAEPSDCSDWAVGEQTGQMYEKIGQSTQTVTTSITLDAGAGCGLGAEGTRTVTETYNVGTYQNQVTGARVQVNCSTGEVID